MVKKPLVVNQGRYETLGSSDILFMGATFKTLSISSDLDLSSDEGSNYNITADTSNGDITITLPSALNVDGVQYVIKNIGSNKVILQPQPTDTIDNEESLEVEDSTIIFASNGDWWVVSTGSSDSSSGGTCTDTTSNIVRYFDIINSKDPFDDGSLDAKFLFDGNVNDLLGKHTPATYANLQFVDGVFGQAVYFNGVDAYISVGDVANNGAFLDKVQDDSNAVTVNFPFCICARVKFTGTDAIIYAEGGESNGIGFGIRDSKPYLATQYADVVSQVYGNTILSPNKWYFLLLNFDGSNNNTYEIWLNGKLEINGSGIKNIGPRLNLWSIGSINNSLMGSNTFYDDSNSHYLECYIDQLQLFYRTLSEDEIKQIYNEQKKVTYENVISCPIRIESNISKIDVLDDNSEVLFLRFEDNVLDEHNNYSISGHDYSFVDSFIAGSKGVSFTNTGILLLDNAIGGSQISFSLWYQHKHTNINNWQTLLGIDGGNYHHLLISSSDIIGFYNAGSFYTSNTILKDGENYHIIVTKNGGNEKIYLNGIMIFNSNSSFDNNTYPFKSIGNYTDSETQGILGIIDNLRVFNKELTPDEVAQIYNFEKERCILNQDIEYVWFDKIIYPQRTYFVKTDNNPITLTLTNMVISGDVIKIKDYSNNASTNNITVSCDKPIESSNESLVIDVDGAYVELIYVDDTVGWKII